eukprot:4403816-Prymnesium_polylepis.1
MAQTQTRAHAYLTSYFPLQRGQNIGMRARVCVWVCVCACAFVPEHSRVACAHPHGSCEHAKAREEAAGGARALFRIQLARELLLSRLAAAAQHSNAQPQRVLENRQRQRVRRRRPQLQQQLDRARAHERPLRREAVYAVLRARDRLEQPQGGAEWRAAGRG